MSVLILSPECSSILKLFNTSPIPKEPDHDACLGGESRPGLLGGWTCPCKCHRENND